MTRNQKIALGCGGAGCLGLIVVGIVGVVVYALVLRPAAHRAASQTYNFNYNSNSNFNLNSNANDNSADSNSNSNTNSDSDANTSASSLSSDDKHKLFQAATMTGDSAVINRVYIKLGLFKDDFTPTDDYQQFAKDHSAWVFANMDFIRSIGTPDKALAYVEEHLPN
jgi:hypothetical protein